MSKFLALVLLAAASSAAALAGIVNSPEIDAGTGIGAVTLLSGAILVLRSRRRK